MVNGVSPSCNKHSEFYFQFKMCFTGGVQIKVLVQNAYITNVERLLKTNYLTIITDLI